MGAHPEDGESPGYLPLQGRKTAYQEADGDTGGWELILPAIGGGNGGSRPRGDQEICHEEAEHSHSVYCDATDSGPL